MKKAKKTKATGKKKTAKRKKAGRRETTKKELNPQQTWKDVALLVESSATALAGAVINEGKKGQVTPVKFLFEMAKIRPPETDVDQKKIEEEESLARTLMNRLGIPMPAPGESEKDQDEEEEDDTVVIPANVARTSDGEKSEETTVE